MKRRGLLIALIVSLAVNLFVLGGLTGAMMMGWGRHRPPPGGPPRLAAVGAALDPAQRDAWQATIRRAAQASSAKVQEARALRRDAWRGLSAEQIDTQAIIAQLNRSRTLELQARSEMDRAVLGFAATLPAEERRKLAEAFSRQRRGGPPEARSGRGPGPGPHDGPPPPDR
jgi:uncharacterized membrane protein